MRTPSTFTPRVAFVDNGDLRLGIGQDLHLFQGLSQRVAIPGVARHRAHAHDQSLLEGGGDGDLDSELVRRPGLALREALDLGCVQRVQLAPDRAVHPPDAAAQGAQCLLHPLELFGVRVAADLRRQAWRLAVVCHAFAAGMRG